MGAVEIGARKNLYFKKVENRGGGSGESFGGQEMCFSESTDLFNIVLCSFTQNYMVIHYEGLIGKIFC